MKRLGLLTLLAVVLHCSATAAEVIVANTGAPADGVLSRLSSQFQNIAVRFESPSQASVLTSVDLLLRPENRIGFTEFIGGSVHAELFLFSNSALDRPGDLLAVIDDDVAVAAAAFAPVAFAPTAPIALDAATSYWLELRCTDCFNILPSSGGGITARYLRWGASSAVELDGLPGASVPGGFLYSDPINQTFFAPRAGAPIFTVNGTPVADPEIPVPEPAGLATLGSAFMLLTLRRRRR